MKICYGSLNELRQQEAQRKRRDNSGIPDYLGLLCEKMRDFDPDGSKSLKLAKKYSGAQKED